MLKIKEGNSWGFDYEEFKKDCANSLHLKTILNPFFSKKDDFYLEDIIDFIYSLENEDIEIEFDYLVYMKYHERNGHNLIKSYIVFLNENFPNWNNKISNRVEISKIKALDAFNECNMDFWQEESGVKLFFNPYNKKEILDIFKEVERYKKSKITHNEQGTIWLFESWERLVNLCRDYVFYKSILDK